MKRSNRKHSSRRIAQAVCSTPWAIEEGKLAQIVELLQLRAEGFEFSPDEIRSRIAGRRAMQALLVDEPDDEEETEYRVIDGVALLGLQGVLSARMNFLQQISGGTSTQQLGRQLAECLERDDVRARTFDVDSPGGAAAGNEELSQQIRAARGRKPIKSVVTGQCASAAYYDASAAAEAIASPSSEIGSIGTLLVHCETSKADQLAGRKYSIIKAGQWKAVGNSYQPLDSDARAILQGRIDDWNQLFINAVAANRGVSPETT